MEKIGKYELLEKIGTGGFGVVYKGRDPFIKRFVAVKTCSSESEEMRRRFFREAEIAGNLHHKNVTTVYDFGFQDDVPYLVQEFLSGEDLDQVIKRKSPLPDHVKVGYLVQIAAGLDYAHAQGVVHRDIKPSNIRVLDNGRVKIMDFGIAKLTHVESQLTQTGMTLGTSSYLAPEQIKGETVTAAVDVFSFGVLAYELLTFKRPFQGETISSLFYKILSQDPQPLRELWSACDDELAQVVHRCLEKDPTQRYESMPAVLEALTPIEERLRIQAADSDRLPTQSLPLPVDDQSRTAILPAAPTDDQIADLGKRVDRLLDAGDPTAAEVEVTLARKRHGAGSAFDSAVEPILDRIARTRKSRDDERRREEKLNALLERSRELEEDGNHEEALLVLKTAHDLAPDSEEVAQRLEVLQAAVESERRKRERQERAQEVSRLLQEGELKAARESLDSLEDDPEASELVAPLRERLGRSERRLEAQELAEKARASRDDGNAEKALELARRARDIVPDDADIAALISEVEQVLEQEREASRRESKRQEAERQVRAALAAGEVAAARSLLGAAERELPGEAAWDGLRQELEALETQRAEERQRALDRLTAGVERSLAASKFGDARRQIERARPELGRDERLAELAARIDAEEIEHRRSQLGELLGRAEEAIEEGNLEAARSLLGDADPVEPDEARVAAVRSLLEEAETERARREKEKERAAALADAARDIEALLEETRIQEARQALADAKRTLGQDERWEALEEALEEKDAALRRERLENALASGRDALAAGRLAEARDALETAESVGLQPPELGAFRTDLEEAEAEQARVEEERRREAAIAEAEASVRSSLEAGKLRRAGTALDRARAEWPGAPPWHELGEELSERRQAAREARRARRDALLASPGLRWGAAAVALLLVAALAFQLRPEPTPGESEEVIETDDAPNAWPETSGEPGELATLGESGTLDPGPGDAFPPPPDPEAAEAEDLPDSVAETAGDSAPSEETAPTPEAAPSAEALALERRAEQALQAGRHGEALEQALRALAVEPGLGSARSIRDRVVREASSSADDAAREASRSQAERFAPTELRRAVDRRDDGRSAARGGRASEAFQAFTQSAELFRRAGEAARREADRLAAAEARPPTRDEPEETAAVPPSELPPQGPPAADPRDEIRDLLRAYVSAMESRSFAAVQRVFPSVPSAMREPLQGYRSLEMDLTDCSISVEGDRGTARCAMRQVVVPPTGAPQTADLDVQFTLSRTEGGWVIADRSFQR